MSSDKKDEGAMQSDLPESLLASTELSAPSNSSLCVDDIISHSKSASAMRDVELEVKPNDSDTVGLEKELIGPPELRREDDSRPGAFRSGGSSQIAEGQETVEYSRSSSLSNPATDVLLNAELVEEIEYVQAEPIGMSSDKNDTVKNEQRKSRKRWSFILPALALVLGATAIVIGVIISLRADDDDRNEKGMRDSPGQSLHAVVWGYQSDCDDFSASPLEISCPGQIALMQVQGTECSASKSNLTLCETRNDTSVVIFRCLSEKGDPPFAATVTMPAAVATNCRNRITSNGQRQRKLSSQSNTTFGGAAETYLGLGRFCDDSGFLLFRDAYKCQSGLPIQGLPNSMHRRLEEAPPHYCISNNTCAVEIDCEGQDFCEADCQINLDPLQMTNYEERCEIKVDLAKDANISAELKEQYWEVIDDHMLEHSTDSGDSF